MDELLVWNFHGKHIRGILFFIFMTNFSLTLLSTLYLVRAIFIVFMDFLFLKTEFLFKLNVKSIDTQGAVDVS